MFTLPPLPPKDYVLKDVNQNQRSCQEFTPYGLPRITQSNLLKYCAPIQYQENEKLANLDIDSSVSPQVLERWTDQARAFWVDKPGKNDYFVHDMFKKYSVEVMPSYDPRFKCNERVFYRSFKYELDCAEEERLKKLYRKMEREESEEQAKIKIKEDKSRSPDKLGVKCCKDMAPFWWKEGVGDGDVQVESPSKRKAAGTVGFDVGNLRWQDEPNLMQFVQTDPCRRRFDMALIGMPFRSEACNWYYQHYPPPNFRLVHKKFT